MKEKKINKKIIFDILAITLIAILCVSLSPKMLQNDTFYTIKIGEHIVQNKGIDMKDPFSWHENLSYTYPHWLYDVLIYLIYSVGGMAGIYASTCVLAVILGITIYKVNTKLAKNQSISFIITIMAMIMLKSFIAARAQLVTFIFFVLEVYCIEKLCDTKEKKYGIALLIISILVANLHVAVWPFTFVLYLPYIVEYFLAVIEEKTVHKYGKEVKQGERILIYKRPGVKLLIIFMILAILAGFLTPLGTTPYTYLIKTMIGNTTQSISEHQPLVLINSTDVICVTIVLLTLLIFTKTKLKVSDWIMLAGLTLLMFYSKRQTTIFALVGFIILNKLIYQFMEDNEENIDEKLINIFTKPFGLTIITLFVLILSFIFIKPIIRSPYINDSAYPVDMSTYIKTYFNNDFTNVRIYNEYNYGSYLLFEGIPVFIDSRCDLYAPEYNEGQDIFSDFIKSSNLDVYFGDIFEKYDITHVILYKNSKMNMIIEKTGLENYKLIAEDLNFVFYEIEK